MTTVKDEGTPSRIFSDERFVQAFGVEKTGQFEINAASIQGVALMVLRCNFRRVPDDLADDLISEGVLAIIAHSSEIDRANTTAASQVRYLSTAALLAMRRHLYNLGYFGSRQGRFISGIEKDYLVKDSKRLTPPEIARRREKERLAKELARTLSDKNFLKKQRLTDREIFVVQEISEGKSLADIGARLGVSRQRVKQIREGIRGKLPREFRKKLEQYYNA